MPLQATSGAASYDAFGGGVPVTPVYIEDVMSVWLYPDSPAAQTITNGIDLAGKGGLVWTKARNFAYPHILVDTVRGIGNNLQSNTTAAQSANANSIEAVYSNGYKLNGGNSIGGGDNGYNFVSWTLRRQPKFFDVVTFTTGTSLSTNRRISHSLGSVPGCILVKRTTGAQSWLVYHRSTGRNAYLLLDTTEASTSFTNAWGTSDPTSTDFGINEDALCFPSSTYVAYLFAHNAGGFGLSGTDNVISCGGFTKSGSSDVTVNLGFEPQWILMKSSSNTQNWFIFDTMRGMSWSAGADYLNPNTSSAETPLGPTFLISATGFTMQGMIADASYIYIAIRRGPMKTPTTGTSVFSPTLGFAGVPGFQTSWPVDASIAGYRPGDASYPNIGSRLTGTGYLVTPSTAAEATNSLYKWDYMNGWVSSNLTSDYIGWNFRRAPGFFDEVCYTGNAVNGRTINHNLTVAPELMIVKSRSATNDWFVYHKDLTSAAFYLNLNSTAAESQFWNAWNSTTPTSSVFTVGNYAAVNASGATFVAYLFASVPGVSKVGTYTGTGAINTINCGFTGGARFVLIKSTSTTGNWLVWDSARGIVAGNDPYLALNSTNAEVTGTDWVDTAATGFELSNAGGNLANSNGVSYVFLAVA